MENKNQNALLKVIKFLGLFLIGCCIFVISGCGTGQQKSEDKNAGEPKSEISAELLKEHNDLHIKAGQEIHNINVKLTALNEKIQALNKNGGKLTAAQNKEIDEIEKIRALINPRVQEINKVSQEQWESFKTSFDNDIEQVKSRIDTLLNEIKVK
jgi:chromosome segregation ATPase